MKIGQKIPNGSTVIAFTEAGRYGVVLADYRHQYVTWEYFDGQPGSTSNGHYFDSLELGFADFQQRCARVLHITNLRETHS